VAGKKKSLKPYKKQGLREADLIFFHKTKATIRWDLPVLIRGFWGLCCHRQRVLFQECNISFEG
jgi:hypothetical protein